MGDAERIRELEAKLAEYENFQADDDKTREVVAAAKDAYESQEKNIQAIQRFAETLSQDAEGPENIELLLDNLLEFDAHRTAALAATATLLEHERQRSANYQTRARHLRAQRTQAQMENLQYLQNAKLMAEDEDITLDEARETIASFQTLVGASVDRLEKINSRLAAPIKPYDPDDEEDEDDVRKDREAAKLPEWSREISVLIDELDTVLTSLESAAQPGALPPSSAFRRNSIDAEVTLIHDQRLQFLRLQNQEQENKLADNQKVIQDLTKRLNNGESQAAASEGLSVLEAENYLKLSLDNDYNTRAIIEILDTLDNATSRDGFSKQATDSQEGNKLVLQTVGALIKNADKLRERIKTLEQQLASAGVDPTQGDHTEVVKKKFNSYRLEIQELRQNIKGMKVEVKRLDDLADRNSESIVDYELKIDEQTEQIDALKEELENAECTFEHKHEISQLNRIIAQTAVEYEELKQQLDTANADLRTAQQEIDLLTSIDPSPPVPDTSPEAEEDDEDDRLSDLQNTIQSLEKTIVGLRTTIENKEKEIASLQDGRDHNEEVTLLRSLISDLQDQISRLQEDLRISSEETWQARRERIREANRKPRGPRGPKRKDPALAQQEEWEKEGWKNKIVKKIEVEESGKGVRRSGRARGGKLELKGEEEDVKEKVKRKKGGGGEGEVVNGKNEGASVKGEKSEELKGRVGKGKRGKPADGGELKDLPVAKKTKKGKK
ncbi:hypothetical protein GLAREA_10797 [Glarea lozoyensis ATCC 20868]|uniref:Uncharacterized protein n=1 Tax=Glarea lozoyensis (strain ATCC 20868 / MF5171) TaxID=1116229 RepID=S3DSZ8_GLAL2|nr:uncharacterized protein GLAREA_10797 [Glarea lozoyensis ATCC 20868]EPE35101.1 hypothetical protein GLAREA_10797 [Glarea lozoyensis ATCC 20868]